MSQVLSRLQRTVGMTLIVAGLALSTTAMAATEFQSEAQVVWIKRTEMLARIAGNGTTHLEGDAIIANMKSSCEGLQGEQMSHEYGKAPRWALVSQIYACSAFARWSNTGFVKTKVPCVDVQRGIDSLDQMKPADEAPEVVTAATNLKNTLQALLDSAKKSDAALQVLR